MRPPQAEPNRSLMIGQDEKIFALAVAGVPQRRIAEQVGVPQSTVSDRLNRVLAERRSALPAEEFVQLREARLEDLFSKSYAAMVSAERGSKGWAAAWDRCLRAEESLRKLKGADAPEALEVSMDRRSDLESDMITTTLATVVERLGLPPEKRVFAIEAAAAILEGSEPPPLPEDETKTSADARAPWPVHADGREYVIVNGRRYDRSNDDAPMPPPIINAEVVSDIEDVETADDDLTGD